MCQATRKELIEVVRYFQVQLDRATAAAFQSAEDTAIGLMSCGTEILKKTSAARKKLFAGS